MQSKVIRKATRADIQALVDFNTAMAFETEGITLDQHIIKSGVQELFHDPTKGFYIVCEIENSVRACLMITYEWSDWRNGNFWWIQSVYVQKEYRQLGLYKLMYDHIKTTVLKSGEVAGIRLYVDDDNLIAQNVYQKLGMQKSNYQIFEYTKKDLTK